MASGRANLSAVYQQRKKLGSGSGSKSRPSIKKHADGVRSTHEEASAATGSLGSAATQPSSLIAGGRLDVDDECDELEDILRQFDMNLQYGPCLGMTRLERWERAERLGLKPPHEVREILERVGGAPACLWEGRI